MASAWHFTTARLALLYVTGLTPRRLPNWHRVDLDRGCQPALADAGGHGDAAAERRKRALLANSDRSPATAVTTNEQAVRSLTLALLALLPALGQCGALVDCDTGIAPAVVVEVRDANTGEPAAAGSLGTVRDGSYTDSLYQYRSAGGVPLALAGPDERPGTYTVTIEKVG